MDVEMNTPIGWQYPEWLLIESPLIWCLVCNQLLPRAYFEPSQFTSSDAGYCRPCWAWRTKKKKIDTPEEKAVFVNGWYQRNRDKIQDRGQEYHQRSINETLKKHREYKEQNSDRLREKNKEYRKRNHDRIRDIERKWRLKNRDELREKGRKHYWENRDELLERQKKHYWENRDEILKRERKRARLKRIEMRKRWKLSGKGVNDGNG